MIDIKTLEEFKKNFKKNIDDSNNTQDVNVLFAQMKFNSHCIEFLIDAVIDLNCKVYALRDSIKSLDCVHEIEDSSNICPKCEKLKDKNDNYMAVFWPNDWEGWICLDCYIEMFRAKFERFVKYEDFTDCIMNDNNKWIQSLKKTGI